LANENSPNNSKCVSASLCTHYLSKSKAHLKVLVAEFSLSSSDECGIVAQISEPLATADIPAYYISTFKFDHALVSLSTHHFPITKYSASKGEV